MSQHVFIIICCNLLPDEAATCNECVRYMSLSWTKTVFKAGNSTPMSVSISLSSSRCLHFSTSSLLMGSSLVSRRQINFTVWYHVNAANARCIVIWIGRSPRCMMHWWIFLAWNHKIVIITTQLNCKGNDGDCLLHVMLVWIRHQVRLPILLLNVLTYWAIICILIH